MNESEFYQAMHRKAMQLTRENEMLETLILKNVISPRLGGFIGQLLILDFAAYESSGFAQLGYVQRAATSLAEAKRVMDGIYASSLSPLREIDYSKYTIIIGVQKQAQGYSALCSMAKQRYDEMRANVETILGGLAA